jgi:hypothetical protein
MQLVMSIVCELYVMWQRLCVFVLCAILCVARLDWKAGGGRGGGRWLGVWGQVCVVICGMSWHVSDMRNTLWEYVFDLDSNNGHIASAYTCTQNIVRK